MSVFIFMQAIILPWAADNNLMPLWADIALITFVLIMWIVAIDRLAFHVIKVLRKNDEAAD